MQTIDNTIINNGPTLLLIKNSGIEITFQRAENILYWVDKAKNELIIIPINTAMNVFTLLSCELSVNFILNDIIYAIIKHNKHAIPYVIYKSKPNIVLTLKLNI